MSENIYVLAEGTATMVFNEQFALFQQGKGWYYENEFRNAGTIRISKDKSKVILEELKEKFKPEHLVLEGVTIMNREQMLEYDTAHVAEWHDLPEVPNQ